MESLILPFSRSAMPSILPTPKGTFQASLHRPLRSVGHGGPPSPSCEHHCPLLVSFLLPWRSSSVPLLLLYSGKGVVLPPWVVLPSPAHVSAQPTGLLHLPVSQSLSVRCSNVNSGYPPLTCSSTWCHHSLSCLSHKPGIRL